MNSFANLFVVTFFVCSSVKYVSSIVCYECEGFGANSACRYRLDSSMIRVCKEPESYCGYVKLDHYWFFYIKRACGKKFDEFDDLLQDYEKKQGIRVYPTKCDSNLCNSAVEVLSKRMIVFIIAILVLSLIFIGLFLLIRKI